MEEPTAHPALLSETAQHTQLKTQTQFFSSALKSIRNKNSGSVFTTFTTKVPTIFSPRQIK